MSAQLSSDAATPDASVATRVVVGVDGSATAVTTMRWAAAEAARRSASLQVVTGPVIPPEVDYHGIGARRRHDMVDAVGAVRHRYPEMSIEETGTHLDLCGALLDAASAADLLIVGASGSGTAKRCRSGARPRTVARRTSCPLIVVRGRQRQPLRRIVVGFDSSNASAAALAWAVDEADFYDAELIIVHAWARGGGPARALRRDDLDRADAQCMVDLAVRESEKRSNRSISGELIEGEATAVLTAASENADLLAVGSRGRSGFKTMLFGSVALFVTEHAACPVAVIHPRIQVRDPDDAASR